MAGLYTVKDFVYICILLLSFSSICLAAWPTPESGVVCPETDCSDCQWGEVKTLNDNNCTICACKQKVCGTLDCSNDCRFGRAKDGDGCFTCQCAELTCRPFQCSSGFPECPERNGYVKLSNGVCDSCLCRTFFCSHLRCKDPCPYGHAKDEFGCSNCTCLPQQCPELDCDPACEPDQEYEQDERGCRTCACKPVPEHCKPVNCASCSDGFYFKNGCKTCRCKGRSEGIVYTSVVYKDRGGDGP